MDDIKLKELNFLQLVAAWTKNGQPKYFVPNDPELESIKLDQRYLIEMVIFLLEDGSLCFRENHMQRLVGRLRHEYTGTRNGEINIHEWDYPRQALESKLQGNPAYNLLITYTGLRRIEELRESLKVNRILDPLGVLLDWRYFFPELRLTLSRADIEHISVIALDLDNFKAVNEGSGHSAGDEVLKGYMQVVKSKVGTFGTAFRRGGDEVRVILPGFDQKRCAIMAEAIRAGVEKMEVKFQDVPLPPVTTSIGVATSPTDPRDPELDEIADQRQRKAKAEGKNRVVGKG